MSDNALLLKNVRPMGGEAVNMLIMNGRIAQISSDELSAPEPIQIKDAKNGLLLPGFVDGHSHIDKSLWGLPWIKHDAEPSHQGKVEFEARILRDLNHQPHLHSERVTRQCICKGTTHIRAQTDINIETGLKNLEGVLTTREKLWDYVDIQIVAFPQRGFLKFKGMLELLEESIKQGAHLIGGLDPGGSDHDPAGQLDAIFDIASRHHVGIDIHLHDGGLLGALQIDMIAERTQSLGLTGKVAISHAFCLGMIDDKRLATLTQKLVDNEIAIMTHGPGQTPFPPIEYLSQAGVRLFTGSDGIRDAWNPYGNGDMLERAWILSYRSNFNRDEQIELTLNMATYGGADVLGFTDYGIKIGDQADMVVVAGETLAEAVMNRAPRHLVIKKGQVVAMDGQCLF